MSNQITVVGDTERSFSDIQIEVNNTIIQMSNVHDLLKIIVGEKTEIIGKVETVSGTSEEVAASAREIAASSEEQSSNVDKLAQLAQELNGISDELYGKIERFKA